MAADDEVIVISDSETDGDVQLVAELDGHAVQHPLTRAAAAQAQHGAVQQADPDAVQPQLEVVSASRQQEQKPLPALSPQQQQQQQHLTPQKQPQQQSRTPKSKGAAAAGFADAQLQRQQNYMQAFLHPPQQQPQQQTHAIQHQHHHQQQEQEQEQQSALQLQATVAYNGVQQRPQMPTRLRRHAAVVAEQAIALHLQAPEDALLRSQQDRLEQQQQQQQHLPHGLQAPALAAADQQLVAAQLAQAAWTQHPVPATFQPSHSTQPCVQQGLGQLGHSGQLGQVPGGGGPQLLSTAAAVGPAGVGVGAAASHAAALAEPAAKRLRVSCTVDGFRLEAEYRPAAAAPGGRRAPIAAELAAAALPSLPDYSWQVPAPDAAHTQLKAAEAANGGGAAAGGAAPGVLDTAASEDLSLDLQVVDGQWPGFGQQGHLKQQQQQQQQQQAEELPRPAFGGAQACNDDQPDVLSPAELGDKFK